MTRTDRRRLSRITEAIEAARWRLRCWYQVRHGVADPPYCELPAAYCRERAREALREARAYQLRAALLRLRSGG